MVVLVFSWLINIDWINKYNHIPFEILFLTLGAHPDLNWRYLLHREVCYRYTMGTIWLIVLQKVIFNFQFLILNKFLMIKCFKINTFWFNSKLRIHVYLYVGFFSFIPALWFTNRASANKRLERRFMYERASSHMFRSRAS